MRAFGYVALVALAVPALAMAQVGPNPAVRGGSLDPSIRGSADRLTAPQDAQTTGRASGNVLSRTIETNRDAPVDVDTTTDTGATTDTDAASGSTGTTVGTETPTETRTRTMEPGPKRR